MGCGRTVRRGGCRYCVGTGPRAGAELLSQLLGADASHDSHHLRQRHTLSRVIVLNLILSVTLTLILSSAYFVVTASVRLYTFTYVGLSAWTLSFSLLDDMIVLVFSLFPSGVGRVS